MTFIPTSLALGILLGGPVDPADLGSPRYAGRELAEWRLAVAGRHDASVADRLWEAASGSRDPEVVYRARRILRKVRPCVYCHGGGIEPARDVACGHCGGIGGMSAEAAAAERRRVAAAIGGK